MATTVHVCPVYRPTVFRSGLCHCRYGRVELLTVHQSGCHLQFFPADCAPQVRSGRWVVRWARAVRQALSRGQTGWQYSDRNRQWFEYADGLASRGDSIPAGCCEQPPERQYPRSGLHIHFPALADKQQLAGRCEYGCSFHPQLCG